MYWQRRERVVVPRHHDRRHVGPYSRGRDGGAAGTTATALVGKAARDAGPTLGFPRPLVSMRARGVIRDAARACETVGAATPAPTTGSAPRRSLMALAIHRAGRRAGRWGARGSSLSPSPFRHPLPLRAVTSDRFGWFSGRRRADSRVPCRLLGLTRKAFVVRRRPRSSGVTYRSVASPSVTVVRRR